MKREMEPVSRSKNGTPLFECVCPDCGIVRIQDKRKIGRPCAKCAAKRRETHGLSNTKLYRLLKNMIARCTYPSASNYKYYGARGIFVCSEWVNNPAKFVEWALANNYEPGLEIDRINNDGPYSPDNCRFIRHQINSQTRSNASCSLEIASGIKKMLQDGAGIKETAAHFGVNYMVAWHINKGNTWRNA